MADRSELRRGLLAALYGEPRATELAADLEALLDRYGRRQPTVAEPWDETDVWLITYADQFRRSGEMPLRTLGTFIADHLEPEINGVHVLPFYPWSSDDGFSVTDYEAVDDRYGTWEDIEMLGTGRRLMVDAVLNHMSAQSDWFRRFLAGDPAFEGFFRTADPTADLSATTRPRTSPLLHRFDGAAGNRWVWTTFSADQVDLDYRNPAVLLRLVDVLLGYAARGARVIRLDAIAFLWKEEGTTSLHLPQTHQAIQLMRAALDACYPDVLIITETNVPHEENVSYFGDGTVREAQAVYQFPLAPLVLHAAITGDAAPLAQWAAAVEPARVGTTFFNFLGSHDGVGVRPAEGLLTDEEIDALADHSLRAGGRVGTRSLSEGEEAPYELNSTWFDLVAHGVSAKEGVRRHLATHAVMLALPGIPGLYVHSLFGTRNDHEGFAATGINRRLNRRKFVDTASLEAQLADPRSRACQVLSGIRTMLHTRRSNEAFHPNAELAVLDAPPGVFAVERAAPSGALARVVVNFGATPVAVDSLAGPGWTTLLGNGSRPELGPYGSVWLEHVG